jgi:hypothetical protein
MKALAVYSLIFAVFACGAMAQSKSQIVSKCISNINNGITQDQNQLVRELEAWENIFSEVLRSEGADCLSGLTDSEWSYSTISRRFLPSADMVEELATREADKLAEQREQAAVRARICELETVVLETSTTLKLAEEAKNDRRLEVLNATLQECNGWFEVDARAALTNSICNAILTSGGLPNSKIIGPNSAEIALAEYRNIRASREIEFLVSSGMTVRTFLASKARPNNPSDQDDPYDCDRL